MIKIRITLNQLNKPNKIISLAVLISIIILSFFVLRSITNPTVALAQTCGFNRDIDCKGGLTGCTITRTRATVPCTQQGPNSCPTGYSGNKCTYSKYKYTKYYCRPSGSTYTCAIDKAEIGPGYCGCNTGGNADPVDDPLPAYCSSCSCDFGCYDPPSGHSCHDNTAECGYYPDGSAKKACRTCPSECCTTTSCDCTPACTAPFSVSFIQPAPNDLVYPTKVIKWTLDDWGKDSNQRSCSGNSCPYQSHAAGTGTYRLYIDSTNITERCNEATGTGSSAYIQEGTNQCTLRSVDPSWPNTTRTFRIEASNGCDSISDTTPYRFPPNEKPYCTGFEITGGGRRIPVTTGTLPSDFFAAEPDEAFTIRVNAGETDLYGPPRAIYLCFALRRQPNPAQWYCPQIATRSNSGTFTTTYNDIKARFVNNPYANTIETDGFTVTSNVSDNVEAKFCNGAHMYQPTDPASPSCDGGACRLRLHDRHPQITNVTAPNGWIGTEPDADNGLACVDNNPATYKMTLTDPDGSKDIDYIELALAEPGNATDTDNDNVLDNPSLERKWPARLLFTQKWNAASGQEFGENTFWARDTAVDTNSPSSRDCYTSSGSSVPIDPTGWDTSNPAISKSARSNTNYSVWCMGRDSHSWEDGRTTTDQILTIGANDISVDVFYLENSKTVNNDGHKLQFMGSTDWQDASYVAYEREGNRVFVNFKVQFLTGDDGINHWNGTYNNVWHVRDLMWKDDETENTTGAMAGEWIADSQWGNTFHFLGQTNIDLTPPGISIATPSVINATTLSATWGTDEDGSPSGVSDMYVEATYSGLGTAQSICSTPDAPPSTCQLTAPSGYNLTNYTPGQKPETPYLWSYGTPISQSSSRAEYINIGANETGSIELHGFAQDNACNMGSTSLTYIINEPWTITRGGTVFSDEKPEIDIKTLSYDPGNPPPYPIGIPFLPNQKPFDIQKTELFLSSEATISRGIISSTMLNFTKQGLSNYTDLNNRQTWYFELLEAAQSESRWNPDEFNVVDNLKIQGPLSGKISSQIRTDGTPACADANKYCLIKYKGQLSLGSGSNPLTCDRSTAIFVDGKVFVDGDIFDGAGAMEGCVFVVKGDIQINAGSYKYVTGNAYPGYDLIEGFFISDGIINIPEVDMGPTINYRDGLKVHGSLIGLGIAGTNGSSIIMERNLKLRNNAEFPTYVLVHDPKYTQIAKELFGGLNETYKKDIGFKP